MAAQTTPEDEPDLDKVLEIAQEIRGEGLDQAAAFLAAAGDPPELMSPVEVEVRAQAHDLVYPNHEKDWRTHVSFPCRRLKSVVLGVIRVDYWGRIRYEELLPREAQVHRHGYLLIHKAHVRLVLRPKGLST